MVPSELSPLFCFLKMNAEPIFQLQQNKLTILFQRIA